MKTQTATRLTAKTRMVAAVLATLLVLTLFPNAAITALASPSEPDTLLASTDPATGVIDNAFPRLANFWPKQDTLAQIEANARYDFLTVQRPDENEQYRELNPDIIILHYTAASEVNWDPDKVNERLASIATEWILTQVGTELAANVNATQQTLPVETTNAYGMELFKVGETVLVGDELCLVEGVGNDSLTVQRGLVTPNGAHAAGTRIAATVSVWEETVNLDMTNDCPRVEVDPEIGPERANEWYARICATDYDPQHYDGLYVDRVDGALSWITRAGVARSIDWHRTNVLNEGEYDAFDQAVTEGQQQFEAELRANVGPDAILLGNCGVPNYDVMNGDIIEGFPRDDTTPEIWESVIMGPRNQFSGSHSEWMELGRDVNLSTVETYEFDYSTSTTTDEPGFTPNYRKMRFGLTTALLEDGFFSYEMSTSGHGSRGLLWFDEFDNAGEGQGYLGQPLGDAFEVVAGDAPVDLLDGDGGFDTAAQVGSWNLLVDGGYTAAKTADADTVRVDVTASGSDWSGVNLVHGDVDVADGTEYTLSFRAKADQAISILPRVKDLSDWSTVVSYQAVELDGDWQDFEMTVDSRSAANAASLMFSFAPGEQTIWLDDVEISTAAEGGSVWRRDFDGGISLVNPSNQSVTVDLGGEYRKIAGTQVPAVNDGSLVSQVTLPASDGIVLLRETPAEDPPAEDPPAEDPPAEDPPVDGTDYLEIDGPDRYATAVEVSREAFPNGADTVIITTGIDWPDALGGGALAGVHDAPILLTQKKGLPSVVYREVRRLQPTTAIILGGPSAVSRGTEHDLRELGVTEIIRYAGTNRYETARATAKATIAEQGATWDGTVFVATGMNFPDALAGSSLSGATGWPLYLADPNGSATQLTAEFNARGVENVVILGGKSGVSTHLEKELQARFTDVTRIAGSDRYDTAAKVAQYGVDEAGLVWDGLSITTGSNFPDALAGGVLTARRGSVLMLTSGDVLAPATAALLRGNRADIDEVAYLGGHGALGSSVRDAVSQVLR